MILGDIELGCFLGVAITLVLVGSVKTITESVMVSKTNLTSNQIFKAGPLYYQCAERTRQEYLQDQLKLEGKIKKN